MLLSIKQDKMVEWFYLLNLQYQKQKIFVSLSE